TPIANPGRASIQAALAPAANPLSGDPLCQDIAQGTPCLYLYYVLADKNGRHDFAVTLAQHEANIQKAIAAGVL
ncbi:MAG: endolytic transglycosylase MltG, partial [Actinomycetota bacterium]